MTTTEIAPRGSEQRMPTDRLLTWIYLLGGAVGLAASAALLLEQFALLAEPDYIAACTFDQVLSCNSVMESSQAAAFGIPNTLIGVTAFSVVLTAGVVLHSGFAAPRWFWTGLQLGSTFGVLFVHWLIYQSLYTIQALCPYCMVVWAVTIPIFWYTTLHNLPLLRPRGHLAHGLVFGVLRRHLTVLAAWYLAVAALVLHAFGDYWATLLP
ncbi:vitamin K epoxide reductase family protein [Haloechinothrix sp. LS1_15]|uniref:vitamin K epoxide reductase family protein n=1 Tax=Haloechinothrix sp. LS1_15 TaxID=2652248 RepID=UPI0029475FFD|nr:vitamin K epoxide reductase family protein [Haloechinothrix sp. LS1_15]MDV6012885.1 vitamin K epoxide reductase family protein [Haloechinothrix sp. LS1_15]